MSSRYERQLAASRAAKAKRRGRCETCGAETRYSGGKGSAVSRECPACAARRIGLTRRGQGRLGAAILRYLGDGERRYRDIRDEVLRGNSGLATVMLNRLVRYELVERVDRGVYRRAAGRLDTARR